MDIQSRLGDTITDSNVAVAHGNRPIRYLAGSPSSGHFVVAREFSSRRITLGCILGLHSWVSRQ